ncbi:g1952 [Coccomyxa viridis]|uniref:G1952 protein n=1 Tax=Coccomyxa viridis TaxID=1274662 RepID=A0ABP1FR34_9CHLO
MQKSFLGRQSCSLHSSLPSELCERSKFIVSQRRKPLLITLQRPRPSSSGDRRRGDGARERSRKGNSYENKTRRKGRPAHKRTPDDSPLRDGNRDRLIGLLTERASRTLLYYLSETNQHVYHWLIVYIRENPIPRTGSWDDISGETFLRGLLSRGIEIAQYSVGRDSMYDHFGACGVDPRNLAQRIMEIRTQIANEMIDDLKDIAEENSLLMRESLFASLSLEHVVEHPHEQAPDQEPV